MNKSEERAMGAMSPAFRLAWVNALADTATKDSVAALAAMFQFPDAVEVTWAKLKAKADKFPREVARHVVLSLARSPSQNSWDNGIVLLKRLPRTVVDGVFKTVANQPASSDIWEKHVRKLRRALR